MMYRHSKNRGTSDMQSINTYLIPALTILQSPVNMLQSRWCMRVVVVRTKQEQASKPGFCCPPPPPQNAPLSTKTITIPQNALCCVMSRRVSSPKCRVWPFLSRASVTRVGLSYLDKIMRGLGLSGNRAFLTRFCYRLGLLCRVSCRVENWRCLMFDIMKYCMLFSIDVSSHLNVC